MIFYVLLFPREHLLTRPILDVMSAGDPVFPYHLLTCVPTSERVCAQPTTEPPVGAVPNSTPELRTERGVTTATTLRVIGGGTAHH